MMIAILGGLGASISWAAADIFIKKSVDKINSNLVLFLMRLGGLICVSSLLFLDKTKLDFSSEIALMIIVLGVMNLFTTILLLFAFKNGKVSLVTPIISTYTLLSALISFIFFKEEFGIEKVVLVTFVYLGVLLAGIEVVRRDQEENKALITKKRIGFIAAIVAMVSYAIYFPVFDNFIDRNGWGVLIIMGSAFEVLLVIPFMLKDWNKTINTPKSLLGIALLAGILNGFGDLALLLGLEFSEDTTVTVAIASSTSAVAVLFAYIFLKERMRLVQYLGIGVVALGLVLSVIF